MHVAKFTVAVLQEKVPSRGFMPLGDHGSPRREGTPLFWSHPIRLPESLDLDSMQ